MTLIIPDFVMDGWGTIDCEKMTCSIKANAPQSAIKEYREYKKDLKQMRKESRELEKQGITVS